ncbi:MAG TPA: LLM class F420-dependent oxidoreductase [Cellulomonas sp.]
MDLRRFALWRGSRDLPPRLAADAEEAGFSRLWIGGVPASLEHAEAALATTSTLKVASGIVNIWRDDAVSVAASFHRLEERYPGRFLLGIGTGHPESVQDYSKPYEALSRYLDVLDEQGVPTERRILAALGPRVLRLARDRSSGAHPYLVTAEHTAQARAILGPDKLLVPEHKVVLDADPQRARAVGRPRVQTPYLGLVNYRNNLRRLGFTDDDMAGAGSDRLIDAVVAHGTPEAVAAQLAAHLDAGADEVAIQLLTPSPDDDLRPLLAELADALTRFDA